MKCTLNKLYTDPSAAQKRYQALAQSLVDRGRQLEQIRYFSAPGRTELGGNHTDHQNGHVLAAAVEIDMAAAAVQTEDGVIRVFSEGYAPIEVELKDLSVHADEKGSSASIVRGIAYKLTELGRVIGGFDLAMDSAVPRGSGLSSSAAFEVLIGTVMNALFCGGSFTDVEIAQIGQWAENVYFDKPCGLMDQMASSVGGVVAIDFHDPKEPEIRKLAVSPENFGYCMAILRCGDDHADLTDEYGAITSELHAAAACYGKQSVLELDRAAFMQDLPFLRKTVGDRAILRTFHVWADDARAAQQADALQQGDFARFLELVRQSGRSSWMYLQNVLSRRNPTSQGLGFTLALCEQLLGEKGAYRVHGGGFAGTAQAYVPCGEAEHFRAQIDAVLGEGACMLLKIRAFGGTELEI